MCNSTIFDYVNWNKLFEFYFYIYAKLLVSCLMCNSFSQPRKPNTRVKDKDKVQYEWNRDIHQRCIIDKIASFVKN